MADARQEETIVGVAEYNEDHYIDTNGTRWGLSCVWPAKNIELEIPAFLCIDEERRKRAWVGAKLTNAWTGDTEETWQKRQAELMQMRLDADRSIAEKKREREHPGQYWDPCEKQWVFRATPGVTAAVKKARGAAPGWACPGLGTSCCMAICEGGAACMMRAAGEVA